MALRGRVKSLLCAWLAIAAWSHPGSAFAFAASTPAPTGFASLKPAESAGGLHPAMWKIVNGKSTVYLLGSVHALPVDFSWHTPTIDQAISAADSFAFEANLDFSTAEFHYFIDNYGYLPRGQTLHGLLSPAALKQYVTLIQNMRIDPNKVDYLRPGVAVLLLERAFITTRSSVPLGPGVDAELVYYAKSHTKELRYLESLQSQFDLLTKLGGGTDVAVLEKKLTSHDKGDGEFRELLAAWARGDLTKLASLDDTDPKERVLLLDSRNQKWIRKIEAMLDDPRTYFVTVGAMHLTGPTSVISLLCAKHWNVQRIATGSGAAAPACEH
jgi:uncharacterized protein YbaP (TraB family)